MEGPPQLIKGLDLSAAFKKQWVPQSREDLHRIAAGSGAKIETIKIPLPVQPVKADTDVAVSAMSGGRAIGDPLDREPERVLEDFNNKITSVEMAKRVYGVIIDRAALAVDLKATQAERDKIKADRRRRGKVWPRK